MRELLHYGVIDNPFAVPHAYAPIARVKEFFLAFRVCVYTSEDIHQLLKEHLGGGRGYVRRGLRYSAADHFLG